MATKYPNNFEVELNEPLDTKFVCENLSDLTDYLYVGLMTYQKSDGKYYSYKGTDSDSNPIWEEITADVLQSKNLLKNSNFEKGSYVPQDYWKTVTSGSSSTIGQVAYNNYFGANAITLRYLAIGQDIILERGKTYTLSFYYNMGNTYGNCDAYIDYRHVISEYFVSSISYSDNLNEDAYGFKLAYNPYEPQKATITFTVKDSLSEKFTSTIFQFGSINDSGDSVTIGRLQLEEGDTATEYSRYEENFATIDDINEKQEKLVSGTNIKTINGNSILGNGNIEIKASDLGISSPLYYLGVTTTEVVDGYSNTDVVINDETVTATTGATVFYNDKEFIYNGTAWEELGGGSVNTKYDTTLGDLATEEKIGGIPLGTTADELKDKTFTQLFDALLFPDKDPSHTNPSVGGFTLNPTTTPVEVGSAVASVSAATLNKGVWSQYNNNLAYAGDITEIIYEIKINGTTYNTITGLPETYDTPGNHTYKATVKYGVGPTPVNNKGNERPSLAAQAGSVSATRTKNVTYPYYLRSSSGLTKKLNNCTVSGTTGTITVSGLSNIVPGSNKTETVVAKVYGKLTELNVQNPNSDTVHINLLEKVVASEEVGENGEKTGYTLYSYPASTQIGEVKIISLKIEFTV